MANWTNQLENTTNNFIGGTFELKIDDTFFFLIDNTYNFLIQDGSAVNPVVWTNQAKET